MLPVGGEIIENRVRIPNDPVTVIGEQATKCHCVSEKAWYAETRKSGNLLCVVVDRYLPQKVACLKHVCSGIPAVSSLAVLVALLSTCGKQGLFAVV